MDEHMKMALDIVKAQASVRPMSPDEMAEMLDILSAKLKGTGDQSALSVAEGPAIDPKTSIKEKSITCCECGKSFKVLTKRHLAMHDMTPEEYREKYGFKKGTALVAKTLQRERRVRMKEMKLWERRGPIAKKEGPKVPESKFPGREEADV